MILFFTFLSVFAVCFYFYYSRKTSPAPPSLHRKWTWKDELKDNYKDWLPLATIILVLTLIIVFMIVNGVGATESNIYYYHLGGS